MATKKLLLTLFMCRLIVTFGLTLNPSEVLGIGINDHRFSLNPTELVSASHDFGGQNRAEPLAIFHPTSADDISHLIQAAYESGHGFTVSARGHGHSINGQAHTKNGVVIQMSGSKQLVEPRVDESLRYVDVWGGELWIDVLNYTLRYGLAPKSWTDYLYLSVGGTLSNAGISGQAFNHGPQISNVYELDVITGTLYKHTYTYCSPKGFMQASAFRLSFSFFSLLFNDLLVLKESLLQMHFCEFICSGLK